MAVYVDSSCTQFGRMIMCHMIADTTQELHEMADALKLRRSWFQLSSFPHYDLSLSKRTEAIKKGAVEVDRRELANIMRRVRKDLT